MIQTLIAASSAVTTIVTVSCTDINTLVDRAKVYPDLSVEDRQEIIELYYDKFTSVKRIEYGMGTIKPSLWGYSGEAAPKKKKRK